jgi:site-specific recombinase XerD
MKANNLLEGMDFRIYLNLRRTYTYPTGEHPIILRVQYQGLKKDINTGLSCKDEDWDKDTGLLFPHSEEANSLNEELVLIKEKSRERYRQLKESAGEFSIEELINHIKGIEPPPQTLMDYMDIKLKELEESVDIGLQVTTFYKYRRVKRYLEEFLMSSRSMRNYPVARVDEQFMQKFYNFMRKEKNNSQNTVSSQMSVLSTIMKMAIESGVIKKNPFNSAHFRRKTVNREFLTVEELDQLHKLSGLSKSLELARDQFLFACYTGLAYSDIKELRKGHIVIDADGSKSIHKARYKTDIMSLVPLLPPAEKILLKYSTDSDFRNFKWKVTYNGKLNAMLKEIARLASIDKKLFMHLGRHTFATTITLSEGVSLESVSKMLGHSTIKHTQQYAKITGAKVKNEMSRIIGKYQ